ncbi:MAG: hypothetical protein ACSHW4_09430 [Cellulophaga sp.]
MKLINSINEVDKIMLINSSIYYYKDKNLYDESSHCIHKNIDDVYIRQHMLLSDNGTNLYCFNFQKNKFNEVLSIKAETYEPINEKDIIVNLREGNLKRLKKYSNNSLQWEINFSGLYYNLLNKNTFLLRDSFKTKVISRIDINTSNILWNYKTLEDYYLDNNLNIIKNVLFFTSYKQTNKFKKVTGLDLETGKVIWEHNFELPYHKNIIATLINPLDELCYGYYGNQYQIFNPLTGKIVLQKDIVISDDSNFNPSKNSIYDNKLWFAGGKGENLKFGAIDIHTSELIFIQDFPLENDEQFDVPVYHNGKIYLRGLHKNTLYIFKDESV